MAMSKKEISLISSHFSKKYLNRSCGKENKQLSKAITSFGACIIVWFACIFENVAEN
jgi:hypothetical protein